MALIDNMFKERLRLHSPILASLEKLRLRRNYEHYSYILLYNVTGTQFCDFSLS